MWITNYVLELRARDELPRVLAIDFIECRAAETAGPKWIDSYQGLGYRAAVKTGQLKQPVMQYVGSHGMMPADMDVFEIMFAHAPA